MIAPSLYLSGVSKIAISAVSSLLLSRPLVVVSNVSFVIENNDTVIVTVGCLFVDELICPEVATLHDLLLIEDWEDVKPDHA